MGKRRKEGNAETERESTLSLALTVSGTCVWNRMEWNTILVYILSSRVSIYPAQQGRMLLSHHSVSMVNRRPGIYSAVHASSFKWMTLY
jgi:hypothetical protein